MKYIVNPFKFEKDPGAFLESNITSVEFFSLANNIIEIALNDKNYVDYREPFNQSYGYFEE